jgi:hypothetical protein
MSLFAVTISYTILIEAETSLGAVMIAEHHVGQDGTGGARGDDRTCEERL